MLNHSNHDHHNQEYSVERGLAGHSFSPWLSFLALKARWAMMVDTFKDFIAAKNQESEEKIDHNANPDKRLPARRVESQKFDINAPATQVSQFEDGPAVLTRSLTEGYRAENRVAGDYDTHELSIERFLGTDVGVMTRRTPGSFERRKKAA